MSVERRMILCGGLQSGGTTIVSWCFLQRNDTNGVLDMPNDVIRTSFSEVATPILWCKMTVGSFRWRDVRDVYHDLGMRPEPLLVVRDVRAAYGSLVTKDYGFDGTTAEQPPLRLRFRRFLEDWSQFRATGWPILRYESLVRDPRAALQETCRLLQLPWDARMTSWPKRLADIAYVDETSNATFLRSLEGGSLDASLVSTAGSGAGDHLSDAELDWLESTFELYNRAEGYPLTIPRDRDRASGPPGGPTYDGTRREWWATENQRLWRENERLRSKVGRLRSPRSVGL